MQLTVAIYRQGGEQFLQVEVGPDMTIADLKGILEADTGIQASQIDVFVRSAVVSNNTQTLSASGISDNDMIEVRVRRAQQQQQPQQQRQQAGGARQQQTPDAMAEMRTAAEKVRQQALGDPDFLGNLRARMPDMADAVHDEGRFAERYVELVRKQREAEEERERMLARLEDDPFDAEAQGKIEEIIREQQVMRNYEHALENLPEAFAHVTMLYIPVEVNGTPVKAFVDSGAQSTIMSPGCAERCGILRLLDRRFAGFARGVGTAKILGRVHHAQLKVGGVYLACSFTVMEGKDVDLLFGLDMLKRHQGIIDLKENALHIQGETIQFLPESELPKRDFTAPDEEDDEDKKGKSSAAGEGTAGSSKTGPSSSSGGAVVPPGRASGAQAASAASSSSQPQSTSAPVFPEAHIAQLVALGFSQEEAYNALRATNGNLDQAAAMLFG